MPSKKIYIFSILVGLVIGLVVIVAVKYFSPAAAFPLWVEVAPSTRLFTAKFPVSPERTEAELPITGSDFSLIQEFHTATDGKGNVYHLATFVYPQPFGAEQADEVLDAALQGMVNAAPGSRVLESTAALFDDLPAKLFMIQDKDGHYHQGELFLQGRVLYQAFVTYDGGELAKKDLQYFLDSITPTPMVDTDPAL